MADEAQTIRSINWREVFPFTHLFRAFRIAVHPSKLLLALAALLLIYAGGRTLDAVWPKPYKSPPAEFAYARDPFGGSRDDIAEMVRQLRTGTSPEAAASRVGDNRGIFISFFEFEVAQVNNVTEAVLANRWFGDRAIPGVFHYIWAFLAIGPGILFANHPVYAVLFFAWFLLVWSLFGGAIARIAAVHVARDEKISVRQALRFSISKVLSFLFAPLIPLLIILVIGVIVSAVGWVLLHIPVVGPVIMGLVFFLALLAGFIMTLVALGTIGGFNLMFPTVAVEGSDSFDAISRSFSYVFARPWRMLFYTAVAIAYGALTYLFVRLFIYVLLSLTHFFVGWWLGGQPARHWNGPASPADPPAVIWPAPTWDNLTYNVDYAHLETSEDIAAAEISFWVYLTVGLLGAFAISFYFSANTIVYYLMRREVDATELDDVYVEETEDEFGEPSPAATTPSPAGAAPVAVAAPADATSGARAYGTEGDAGGTTGPTPAGTPSDAPGDSPTAP
jgi:hypothetical protein